MPEFCTCGAELPPDARFCHKCGKPQREEDLAAPAPEVPRAPEPVWIGLALPPVSFRNPLAVRTAVLASSLAVLIEMIPLLAYGFPIWLAAAGFFAVYLYDRRAGVSLRVRQGARLGWITGVISFALRTVLLTIGLIFASTRAGGIQALYRKQLEGMSLPSPALQDTLHFLENPAGLTFVILTSLIFFFLLIALFTIAGGALGAKVLDKT